MSDTYLANITLRAATQNDCRSLWHWRNDQTTREASFDTAPIPYKDHKDWFFRKFNAPDMCIFIIIDQNNHEVGYIRFNIASDQAEISVSVDRSERGRGIGAAAIRLGSERILALGRVNRVLAHIKRDNRGSVKTFQRAGYEQIGTKTMSGITAHEMAYIGCPKTESFSE